MLVKCPQEVPHIIIWMMPLAQTLVPPFVAAGSVSPVLAVKDMFTERMLLASQADGGRCMQDALDRERHRASTFRLLAQAGLATSLAEISTFFFTGQSSGVLREVVIGGIMAAYLAKQ